MKKNIRILAVLLVCIFAVSCFSTSVCAKSTYYTGRKSTKTLWRTNWQPIKGEGEERAYRLHRIPGIVVTKKDTVIVYCEARTDKSNPKYPDASEDWNLSDIYIQRSTNGGETFGAPIYIARGDENYACVNNPVMIVGNDNTLHMLYCKDYSLGGGGIWYRRSTDDGLTWSEERNLTQYTESLGFNYNCFAFGPTHGICTNDGTLMAPVWLVNAADGLPVTSHGNPSSHIFYSKDNGATWDITPQRIFDKYMSVGEMCLAELSNGYILVNGRSNQGKRALANIVDFNNRQMVTGIKLHNELTDPNCCGGMTTANIEGLPNALLYVGCNDSLKRQNITVRCSFDDAKTFSKSLQISSADQGGYSDIAIDSTGKVYVIWEIDYGASVKLTTFSFAKTFADIKEETETKAESTETLASETSEIVNSDTVSIENEQNGGCGSSISVATACVVSASLYITVGLTVKKNRKNKIDKN